MKKFIAVIILMLRSSAAYAFGWEDVSSFVSQMWHDTAGCVSGWFSGGKDTDATANVDALPENIAGKWDRLSENLNDALTLRDKQETLPNSAWFGEDKTSNSKKMNDLLDRALDILSDGGGSARHEALRLRGKITGLRTEIDALRNKRINAPEKTYMFWKDTKKSIDEKISAAEKEISHAENELDAVYSKAGDELAKLGITLTDEQADILMNSVTGEDIIHSTVIFENVKAVAEKLEELSQNDTGSGEITRRYAGMYLVLNDILILSQEQLAAKIDGEYSPRLTQILNEAESLRKDALSRSNSKSYTPAQRKQFAQNAKSNADTIKAAKLYRKLLSAQKSSLKQSLDALRLNRDLAENTYKTIRSSGELQGLIRSGLKAIDAVMKLSMPELNIFQGNILRAEFDEINRRLKRE